MCRYPGQGACRANCLAQRHGYRVLSVQGYGPNTGAAEGAPVVRPGPAVLMLVVEQWSWWTKSAVPGAAGVMPLAKWCRWASAPVRLLRGVDYVQQHAPATVAPCIGPPCCLWGTGPAVGTGCALWCLRTRSRKGLQGPALNPVELPARRQAQRASRRSRGAARELVQVYEKAMCEGHAGDQRQQRLMLGQVLQAHLLARLGRTRKRN